MLIAPHRRGLMMVLSSPSGAGKTTIARAVLEGDSQIGLSVSVTTRAPREGEVAGRDYHFVSLQDFDRMAAEGQFLEHAQVFGNRYGTLRAPVMTALERGRDILFDIDWQGTQQLAEHAVDDLVRVFLLPPSTAELERRLRSRALDSHEIMTQRMEKASEEISHYFEYDWVIINHDLETSVASVRAILCSERLRRRRQVGLGDFVKTLRDGRP